MDRLRLKDLYCQKFSCAADNFEARVFSQCLPMHARVIAPLIRTVAPGFFAPDSELVRYLGNTTAWREAQAEIVTFQDRVKSDGGFLRKKLRIRVSGKLVTRLAFTLFRRAQN